MNPPMQNVIKLMLVAAGPVFAATRASEAQMLAGDPIAKAPPPAATQPAPVTAPPMYQGQTVVIHGARF
jgi:hypothetical protein